MLKHIVFFTLKSEYTDAQKQQAIKEIVEILKKLPSEIPQILYYEVIANEAERQGGSDIGLISGFENFDDLNIYRNHPKHIEAVKRIKQHTEKSTYIDYTKNLSIFEK